MVDTDYKRKGDAALITLYDQQGVKSFLGKVGAFITQGPFCVNRRRRERERERDARTTVDSFMNARFLETPTHLSLTSSSLWQRDVIFIHTRRVSRTPEIPYARESYAAPGVTERAHGG